jgi:hypothetical protein
MNQYRVKVVASYPLEVDLPRLVREMTEDPSWEASAVDWTIETSVMVPPPRQTLEVEYDAEGRDEDEARRFAVAIFRRESSSGSLPEPETVVAHAE